MTPRFHHNEMNFPHRLQLFFSFELCGFGIISKLTEHYVQKQQNPLEKNGNIYKLQLNHENFNFQLKI